MLIMDIFPFIVVFLFSFSLHSVQRHEIVLIFFFTNRFVSIALDEFN